MAASIASQSSPGGEPAPAKKLRRERGKLLQAAHDAATLLAEKLDDATLDENRPDRRRARNGYLYSKDEFMQWYGDDRGENEWERATPVE